MLIQENLGVFEEKYRRHYLSTDVRQSIFGLIFLQVPNISFIFSDYQFFRSSVSFNSVLGMRIGFFVLAIVLAFVLIKVKNPKQLDQINLAVTLSMVGCVAFICLNRMDMFLSNIGIDVLVVLGCYLIFPNRLKLRVFPAMLYTVFFFTVLILNQENVPIASLNILFLSMFLANLMGLFISNQFHFFRRKRFRTCELLLAAQSELKALANTDSLTELPNRRRFFELGDIELKRFQRYSRSVSILIIDLDHFKSINDQYGHSAGDAVLVEFAQSVKNCLRSADVLGRIGGEEFGILLPETTLADASLIADRVNKVIRQMRVSTEGGILGVSISIGVAQAESQDIDLESFMKRADAALYQAKNLGRDQVCVA